MMGGPLRLFAMVLVDLLSLPDFALNTMATTVDVVYFALDAGEAETAFRLSLSLAVDKGLEIDERAVSGKVIKDRGFFVVKVAHVVAVSTPAIKIEVTDRYGTKHLKSLVKGYVANSILPGLPITRLVMIILLEMIMTILGLVVGSKIL